MFSHSTGIKIPNPQRLLLPLMLAQQAIANRCAYFVRMGHVLFKVSAGALPGHSRSLGSLLLRG
jgi:hypothetical protein